MTPQVTLPLWFALIISALAIWAAFERIVLPAVRYLLRRHGNREVDPDAAVIFVINHRSNMDYVLVTYMASSSSALSDAIARSVRNPVTAIALQFVWQSGWGTRIRT
jgi:1-acyl-sn-glycerol-3-phosphate acyltransferase